MCQVGFLVVCKYSSVFLQFIIMLYVDCGDDDIMFYSTASLIGVLFLGFCMLICLVLCLITLDISLNEPADSHSFYTLCIQYIAYTIFKVRFVGIVSINLV